MSKPLTIKWINRFDSLEPSALLGFDETAIELKKKLLSYDDERLSGLQGVFRENLIFLTGKSENLPWVNGVIYLGKDPLAPAIFLPTKLRPSIPVDLFERALLKRFSDKMPFAVLGDKIISTGKMLPVSREILKNLFAESEAKNKAESRN